MNFRISKHGSSARPRTLWENKDRELATEVKEESVNILIPLQMAPQWRELVMEKQKAREMESIRYFFICSKILQNISKMFTHLEIFVKYSKCRFNIMTPKYINVHQFIQYIRMFYFGFMDEFPIVVSDNFTRFEWSAIAIWSNDCRMIAIAKARFLG